MNLADSKTAPSKLTAKQKAGDFANKWFERNRSLVLRQTPFWAQSLAAILISLGTLSIVGGLIFRIDEVVTVTGQLKSIGGTFEAETPAGGRISDVLVSNGDIVEAGTILVKFDTRKAAKEKATLEKLIKLEKLELDSQLKTLNSQKLTVQNKQNILVKKLDTKTLIADEMKTLVEVGGYQKIQYLSQLDQIFELKGQISDMNQQISRIELQSDQITLRSKKSIDQMNTRLNEIKLQLQYQIVKAPSSGVVFDLKASEGSVMQPGERIVSIVPQKGFYAEIFVPNQDIGFIKPGQSAKVRVDAFPFTRYGEIDGEVDTIGADALEPDNIREYYKFPVTLSLTKNYLESKDVRIPLKSGMSITTNLKLRDKRVISLLSDLLVDQTDSVKSIRQQ
ncbi:HlyD family efflux transporter periplasmic adaptor subunit [Synechococcus sp. A15-28]|uniref:HlyD family efflux transporter periplasmic adaptor subunit n=1 Tax=Synechococcus sp. A15-28 TaxID=1050638 RepID=UPI00164539C3|nr:HlyD family efflux transporter periplasmic adaptor subunit [Synechococcus sp. A15-28]QNI41138.1 hlyD secretion family protein [Synechococcus sp. A15-28]